jgi:quinol monooxygenase YgiN
MKKDDVVSDNQLDDRRRFVQTAGLGGVMALAAAGAHAGESSEKPDACVGLVPYFEVNEGKLDEFKTLGPKFVELTKKEAGVLYYAFSFSGQAAHCREGYVNAEAVLAHLANVDAPLKQALSISKITRLEVHGPEAEVEKLREPLKGLNPQYFVLADGGFRRG